MIADYKELRSGNSLLTSLGAISTATWGVIRDVEYGDGDYLPIPLSEKRLIQLGFEKNQNYREILMDGYVKNIDEMTALFIRHTPEEIKVAIVRFYDKMWSQDPVVFWFDKPNIKYVHHLQNFYFWVTENKELKLNICL